MSNYKRNEENKHENYNGGIYCITNLKNDKKYIGQTYDLNYRWMRHKSDLRGNSHHNKHLQFAWNKYGEKNFTYEILEYCSLEELDKREIYWINYYNSQDQQFGYNLANGGLGCRGYKHTDEEIMKMRMIQNPEPILQIDFNGSVLNRFISTGEACDYIGKESASPIKRCCDGDGYKQAYGYIWIYEKDLENFKLENHIIVHKLDAAVSQFSMDNKLIKNWDKAKNAAKEVNGSASEILRVCTGKRVSYKGFIWKYTGNEDLYDSTRKQIECKINEKRIEETLSVLQYSPTGQFVKKWNNSKETEKDGFNRNSVGSCCAGNMIWYKEFIWIYEKDIDTIEERVNRLKNSKIKTIPILQFDLKGNLIKEWKSVNSIAGFSKDKIKRCLKNQTYISENYIWKYKYPELVY